MITWNCVPFARILSRTSQPIPIGWEWVTGVWIGTTSVPGGPNMLLTVPPPGFFTAVQILSLSMCAIHEKGLKALRQCFCFRKPRLFFFIWCSLWLCISVVLKPDWKNKKPIETLKYMQGWVSSGNSDWDWGKEGLENCTFCFSLSEDPWGVLTGNQVWEPWSYPETNSSNWGLIQPPQ